MEEKLEEYRLRKRRAQRIEAIKSKILNMFTYSRDTKETIVNVDKVQPEPLKERNELLLESESFTSEEEEEEEENTSKNKPEIKVEKESQIFKYTLRIVFLLFWTTLYIIAIELAFGIVFLMFSALFGIYFNTRTEPKKRNEISAYSVFNKNCESIDGTLKAEQFEQELRYGPGAVR